MERIRGLNLKDASNRLRVLLLAILFSLPLGQQGIVSLLLAVFAVQSIVLYTRSSWIKALRDPVVWTSMLYFSVLLISLLWSDDWQEGLRQLETKLSFLLIPLFIVGGRDYWDEQLQRKGILSFVLGNGMAMAIALGYAIYRSVEVGAPYVEHEFGTRYFFLYKHLSSPIMHPGYMATYVGVALLGLLSLYKGFSRKRRVYSILGSTFMLSFMLMLQARINVLAILLVLGVVLLFKVWKANRKYAVLLPGVSIVALAAVVYLAPSGLSQRYLQLPDFSYDIQGDDFNSATFRLAIWKCNASVIQDQPLFGTGIGDNRLEQWKAYEDYFFWQGMERKFNAHNQYLETMVASGIAGLTLFFLMLAVYIRRAWLDKNLFMICALVFLALSLLTESMFERMWAVQLFTILFPLMLISYRRK